MNGLVGLEKLKFPDECFPFDIHERTQRILHPKGRQKRLYRNNAWVNYPIDNTREGVIESRVCAVLNSIGKSIMTSGGLGRKLVRKWTSRFASSPVPRERCMHQLDIVLMNTAYVNAPKDRLDWSHILCETKLKVGATVNEENNARLVFSAQPDRRFVLGLSLVNSALTLNVFNRGCLMTSDTFDIHQQPERLIRIVAGFMFANREYLGFDKKMEITEVDGQCSGTVTINANTYVIEEVLHVEDVLRGRATVCLRVTRDGRTYVVKNAWVNTTHQMNEPQILQKLEGVKNVTQLVEYECVKLDTETVDSTVVDIERLIVSGQLTEEQKRRVGELDHRQQVRVVLSPFGRPLRMFRSIRELFMVFLDVVEEQLHGRKILHRDISPNNILITDEEGGNSEGRGLLIDFDYAISLLLNNSPTSLHRAGTFPFMAIDVLLRMRVHQYDHDLESLFYVMCYLFCTSAGPDGMLRDDFDVRESVFRGWPSGGEHKIRSTGFLKRGAFSDASFFNDLVLHDLSPYFNTPTVKTCLLQLRLLIFGSACERQVGRHEGTDAKIYETRRDSRDPKDFFGAFKSILRTAYENGSEEMLNPSISSASVHNTSTLAQAEGGLPVDPIDGVVPQQQHHENGSLDGSSSQMSDRVDTGASDSGIAADMGSNTLKRKAASVDEESESIPVRRHQPHRQSSFGESAEGLNVETGSVTIRGVNPKTHIRDKPRRARKRTKICSSNPKVPFPVHDQGEGIERNSNRRVTRSVAKALKIVVA